jgi:hypothetical protein
MQKNQIHLAATSLGPACLLFALLGAASCTKSTTYDQALPAPASATTAAVLADTAFARTLASGNWVVSAYLESGKDKTASFAGYGFTFEAQSGCIVRYALGSYVGTWGGSGTTVLFSVGKHKPVDKMSNRRWSLTSFSSTAIVLDGGDPVGRDRLVLGR